MRPVHHHIVQASITDLMPTQCAIGFLEVADKRKEWCQLRKKARIELLDQHWFPSVLGPNKRHYIIDHHHLGMALHQENQDKVQLTVLKDLSWLGEETFWRVMEFHQWVHPFNENGVRIAFKKLPQHISQLTDDPYRSLAGLARRAGAFAKDITPYSEFLWADYFRARIGKKRLLESWDHALESAMVLAKAVEASYLPGWAGASNT
jgi:hypothetical protein